MSFRANVTWLTVSPTQSRAYHLAQDATEVLGLEIAATQMFDLRENIAPKQALGRRGHGLRRSRLRRRRAGGEVPQSDRHQHPANVAPLTPSTSKPNSGESSLSEGKSAGARERRNVTFEVILGQGQAGQK
jgi:hypothetical protein